MYVVCQFQMEEEEHTDRKQQLAMLYQKINKIKKYLNEGNSILSSKIQTKYVPYFMKSYITPCTYCR